MRKHYLLMLLVVLAGCRAPCPPVTNEAAGTVSPCPVATDAAAPTPKPPAADAAVEPHDACWNAAQRLIMLGCKDTRGRLLGGPNLSGATWSATCRQDLANGVNLNASCIVGANSCTIAEKCK